MRMRHERLSQQEFMRRQKEVLPGKTRHQCALAYAEAERAGEVVRKRNVDKRTPYEYGLLLHDDVERRLAAKKRR